MRRPLDGVLAVAVTVSLLVAAHAAGQGTQAAPSRSVTAAELAQMLKGKDFFMVNVLATYQGEIPQTDAFISYQDTPTRLGLYPADKGAKIVLYCLTGKSAATARQDLVAAGYTNVVILEGGMRAWERQGRTVLHRGAAPAVPYPAAPSQSSGPVPDPCPCGLPPAKP